MWKWLLNILGDNTPPQQQLETLSYSDSDISKETLMEVVSAFLSSHRNLKQFYKDIESIQDCYIADVILEQLTTDALVPDITTNKILTIHIHKQDKSYQAEFEKLKEIVDFDLLIQDILTDLISYGDYTLRPIIEPGKGIIEIQDNVLPGTIIPIYKGRKIVCFIELSNDNTYQVIKYPANTFVKFFISTRRIRLRLPKKLPDAPDFVKIGTPLFTPGIIKKIKELDLLEKLIPASKIQQISKGNVVGVYVPPSLPPADALKYAKKLENKLNGLGIGVDKSLDQLSIVDILKGAGKVKVIPVTSEKGQVTKLDYKSEEPSELLNSIKDLREVILTSVGIPPELVFSSGEGSKGEILKRYSRYYRKIRSIQKAIIEGVRDIILFHFNNANKPLLPEEVEINFANTPINVDDLDKLEFQQATVQILSDTKRFLDDLTEDENFQGVIDKKAIQEYVNSVLTKVGLDSVIKLDSEKGE